jgi:hypothetical protein
LASSKDEKRDPLTVYVVKLAGACLRAARAAARLNFVKPPLDNDRTRFLRLLFAIFSLLSQSFIVLNFPFDSITLSRIRSSAMRQL